MPFYSVTFCTMDQEVGANPFWHSCILLSKLNEQTKKLEIVDNWGFYGLPTTMGDSCFRRLKIKLHLDVDIYGNHGMLRHEEVRYLDAGRGLHGVTFELPEAKFNELQGKCEKMAEEQKQAIDEIMQPLHLQGKPAEKTRIYPHEDYSSQIFSLEKAMAKEQGRPPRLKPFELIPFGGGNTCKAQALKLLNGVLNPEQIARISGGFSRFSGKMEKIFLHSSGPMRKYVKQSGETVCYRDHDDEGVTLNWSVPPQEIETLSKETRQSLKIDDEYCNEIKKLVSQLQRLEWLFTNAVLNSKYEPYREKLLNLIRESYEAFALIQPKKETSHSGLRNSMLWLFSQPRDANEAALMENLKNAKNLIQNLYMSVVDHWELDDSATSVEKEKKEDPSKTREFEDEIDIESLAVCLPLDKQKEICSIIGRSYDSVEPEAASTNFTKQQL